MIRSVRCEKTGKKRKINSQSIENVTNGEASESQHEKIRSVLECEVTAQQLDWLVERVYFIDHPLKGDLIYKFLMLNFDTFYLERFILVLDTLFQQQ